MSLKRLLSLAAALALTLGLTACRAGRPNHAAKPSGGRSDSVILLGSTSMEAIMGALAEQFGQEHQGVTISVEGGGSGAGVEAAANGTAHIGLASRELREEERSKGITGTTLALDGIAIIVNADNPVSNLTMEQIAAIYTGQISNWSQVGGAQLAIAAVGREAGSGTREGFESITGTGNACVLSQAPTSNGAVIQSVRSNPHAIGYVSLSTAEGQKGIKILAVEGVLPSEDTIQAGAYPIQRPFLLITRQGTDLTPQAQAFLDWATSAAAASLIRSQGAVPLAR